MKEKPFKVWAREIQYAFGLENWRLSFEYFNEKDEGGAAATMHAQPQYFEMRLGIYPAFYEQAETHQFEIVLHEFCHVFTEELYRTAVAYSQGKNYHQDSLEATRERNTTMMHLACLTLMKNTKLQKMYSRLKNIKTFK